MMTWVMVAMVVLIGWDDTAAYGPHYRFLDNPEPSYEACLKDALAFSLSANFKNPIGDVDTVMCVQEAR